MINNKKAVNQGPDLASRLALGTAQLGFAYGINNTTGRPTDDALREILTTAQSSGIKMLDTAAAYGDSEVRLGQWLQFVFNNDFQIVTKISATHQANVTAQILASLGRLHVPAVYGLMFHGFGVLQEYPAAWQALQQAQAEGQTKRIGVSLYHPDELNWLFDNCPDINLVQVPYNVFDQRFGPYFMDLAQRGIEVHIRSVFLQGVLLREPAKLPAFFAPITDKISKLRQLADDAEVPLAALLLLFAAQTPGVSRAVMGVDSAANLYDNLAAANYFATAEALRPALLELAEATTAFTLPYTWPRLA